MEDTNEVDGIQEPTSNPNLKAKLKKAQENYDAIVNCPEGYIDVKLSTRGLISECPESFRIRNFSPEDLMNLGLADREEVPIRLIKVLDSLIFNPNRNSALSVENWHEKEVIELLLLLYETFYTTVFPNQEWIPTEEDWEYLKEIYGGPDSDEFRGRERALKNKSWKPTFDIDISQLDYHEIPDDFKTKVKIDRKYGDKDFSAVFSLPKFGDFMKLKFFIDDIYKEEDRQFARIAEIYKFRKEAEDKILAGENINIASVPNVPKAELDKYKEYETKKSLFAITASKALYLQEFDGEDLSRWPLVKKLDMAKDARLDYTTFKMVQDHFSKLKFGLKEEITVHDPILNKVVQRNYSFQLTDLLAAIRDSGAVQTTVSYI